MADVSPDVRLCFYPLPLKRMKKFLNGVAALAAMAVIALPACSGSGSNIAETTQSADTTATVAEAPAPAAGPWWK